MPRRAVTGLDHQATEERHGQATAAGGPRAAGILPRAELLAAACPDIFAA